MTPLISSSNFRFDPLKNVLFAPIPLPILMSDKLIHVEKELYGILRMFAGDDGECFPKDETMAKLLNVSERTIKRAIAKLIQLQLIRKFKKDGIRHFEFLPHEIFDKPKKENSKNIDKKKPSSDPPKNRSESQLKNDIDDIKNAIKPINKKKIIKPYKVICDRVNQDDLNQLNNLCQYIVTKISLRQFNPFQFAQTMLNQYRHIRSIIDALQAVIKAIKNGKKVIKNFWAYCFRIVGIQSGNYYAREEEIVNNQLNQDNTIIYSKISQKIYNNNLLNLCDI